MTVKHLVKPERAGPIQIDDRHRQRRQVPQHQKRDQQPQHRPADRRGQFLERRPPGRTLVGRVGRRRIIAQTGGDHPSHGHGAGCRPETRCGPQAGWRIGRRVAIENRGTQIAVHWTRLQMAGDSSRLADADHQGVNHHVGKGHRDGRQKQGPEQPAFGVRSGRIEIQRQISQAGHRGGQQQVVLAAVAAQRQEVGHQTVKRLEQPGEGDPGGEAGDLLVRLTPRFEQPARRLHDQPLGRLANTLREIKRTEQDA